MQRSIAIAAAFAACTAALARLPSPDDAAKAKAAEAGARTAWQAKVAAYELCQVQDKLAARYKTNHPAAAKAEPAAATAKATPAATPASSTQGPATPVATVAAAPTVPPCSDPGAFAYAPASQKPLETSEAHSPAATATSPPSVRAESGTMTSGKK